MKNIQSIIHENTLFFVVVWIIIQLLINFLMMELTVDLLWEFFLAGLWFILFFFLKLSLICKILTRTILVLLLILLILILLWLFVLIIISQMFIFTGICSLTYSMSLASIILIICIKRVALRELTIEVCQILIKLNILYLLLLNSRLLQIHHLFVTLIIF